MIFVGVPQSEGVLFGMDKVEGGSFYGASTLSGGDGLRLPSDSEKAIAKALGSRVTLIGKKLRKQKIIDLHRLLSSHKI